MTFREISYWRLLLAVCLENSDMFIIEVSGNFHENRSRFNIFHDKSLSSFDGNTANQRRQNRPSLQTIPVLLQVVYVPSFVCQKPKWEQKQGGCTVGQVIYSFGTAGVRARKVEHLKLKPSMHMRNLNGNI